MGSSEILMIGCAPVFAGLAAESFAAHRRLAVGEPARRPAAVAGLTPMVAAAG